MSEREKTPSEIETLKIGDIEIKLPKEGLSESWEKAKKIIDIYIENK